MEIRPAKPADIDRLLDIDGTIESAEYLHLDRTIAGLAAGWKLEPRPLRDKLIQSNPIDDERQFLLKQIVTGADEGMALLAEHENEPVALLLAQPRPSHGTLHLVELRVDYDHRRNGIGSVLMCQLIQTARDQELRAVSAETRTNNVPANRMLQKLSFQITGVDTHRHSNHDMVKEAATIFWYAEMD